MAVSLAVAVVAVAGPDATALSRGVLTVARMLAATLFLTAGGLRLSRWWMTSEARSAYMGASLVVLGGATLPLWHLANALDERDTTSLVPVLTRTVGTAVCVGLVVLALSRGDDDSLTLHPRLLLARGAGVTAGACALLFTAGMLSPGLLEAGPLAHLALDAAMVCAWSGIGTAAFLRGSSQRWAGRAAPLLAAMAVVELMRLLGTAQDSGWLVAAAVLSAAVATLTAAAALQDLFDAADAAHQRAVHLSAALATANTVATEHDAWREELTHDLRNALAGLRAALSTLARYDGQLDELSVRQLRDAALEEIDHLAHLIDGADNEEVVDFEVAGVVRTLVRTRRATGQSVRLTGTAGVVRGRPGDLATVLQNLLVNAAVHAPGCPVTVQLVPGPCQVEIVVSDQGPGLTAAQAGSVFDRGVRSADSPGSGLGLYVARTLLRRHGGDVELRDRVGGATFVVRLPVVERRGAGSRAGSRLSRTASA